MQALLDRGYTLIDGVFNAATCQTFRNEIRSLKDLSLLHLNSTHLVKGDSRRLLPKHGIYEAEVADKVLPVGLLTSLACHCESQKDAIN